MKLVSFDDPILLTPCQQFDFANPPFDPIEFANQLVKFMYDNDGIGLAANQVGVPYKIFAMRGSPENFVCFNPRIVSVSKETMELDEGCLTFPNLFLKIERPQHIRARFQLPNGKTQTNVFTGMTAKIFQHENEHLNGKLFVENVSRLQLQRAIDKAKKANRNYNGSGIIKHARKNNG